MPTAHSALLVSAGEPSGDRLAARVVGCWGRPSFGLGGDGLASAGAHLYHHLTTTATSGLIAPVARLPTLFHVAHHLLAVAKQRRTRRALLVDFTEFHAYLGRRLRQQGVRVLWLAAPQVWAWRARRIHSLQRSFDRLAVLFAFEEPLWRQAGADAHWVGHPLAEEHPVSQSEARRQYNLPTEGTALALLPGSRTHEIRRMLPPMLAAATAWRASTSGGFARLLLSGSLPSSVQSRARYLAARAACPVIEIAGGAGAGRALPAFDLAYCTAGTVTLEAALTNTPPVIMYQTDPISAWLARRLVQVRAMGLPNILLQQPIYPEHFQECLTTSNLLASSQDVMRNRGTYELAAVTLRRLLQPEGSGTMASRTAELLDEL